MSCPWASRAVLFLLFFVPVTVAAQTLSFPSSTSRFTSGASMDAVQATKMDFDVFEINSRDPKRSPVTRPSGSVSVLDLKAPRKAQREYQEGYQLLFRKDLQGAVQHLHAAVQIYPNFVAAHNALGTAYLQLNQYDQARDEFRRAIVLDDHMPNSYLNLGIAQLSLQQYPLAEESFRKACSIAPMDLQLALALAYAEFANHDYSAVIATASQVHSREHKGAELVHYFAAGALGAQDKLVEAQREMETLITEDPGSPYREKFGEILQQMKTQEQTEELARQKAAARPQFSATRSSNSESERAAREKLLAQRTLQDVKESNQIAEAEADPDLNCASCGSDLGSAFEPLADSNAGVSRAGSGFVMRSAVDEIDVFFAATDHGNSVTNLTPADIRVLDNGRSPVRITSFRNHSELPLRLGVIIDTSDSVKERLGFEEKAATKFLEHVLTDNRDLAFVVGVNNSVLVKQDFTSDHALIARAVSHLTAGGGTAVWDAVAFASSKLASHEETQPVARVLVLISDGQDNSSNVSLKQAAEAALHGETIIYTVSTRDVLDESSSALLGDHALKTLSELTGGASFVPGSARNFEGSLRDVQEVIRGRYLVTYKPAVFTLDGRYRTIELKAERDGRQLRVFSRKGYYASAATPGFASDVPAR